MSSEKDAKLKALNLTLDKLDKAYGKGTVMRMSDAPVIDVEVISSGSLGLDIALGQYWDSPCASSVQPNPVLSADRSVARPSCTGLIATAFDGYAELPFSQTASLGFEPPQVGNFF